MPTENRRVATYLPKAIDERLEAFKAKRGLKDSPALIAILEEYFGVSQEVAHLSSSEYDDLLRRVDDLKTEISQFESRLFGELKGGLLAELRSELLGELKSNLPTSEPSLSSPGQLSFLEPKADSLSELPDEPSGTSSADVDQSSSYLDSPLHQEVNQKTLPDSELPSELGSELKPLAARDLSRRFGFHYQVVTNNKNKWKNQPGKFTQWSKKSDPNGIAWEFNPSTQLFHPILPKSEDSTDAEDF